MNLYLVVRNGKIEYGTHDSAVVAANSSEEAVDYIRHKTFKHGPMKYWPAGLNKDYRVGGWPHGPVTVTYLGQANPDWGNIPRLICLSWID